MDQLQLMLQHGAQCVFDVFDSGAVTRLQPDVVLFGSGPSAHRQVHGWEIANLP